MVLLTHARGRHNHGLLAARQAYALVQVLHALNCFEAVHYGHFALGEHEAVPGDVLLVEGFLDEVQGTLAVVDEVDLVADVLETQDHQEALDYAEVRCLVVYDEYFPSFLLAGVDSLKTHRHIRAKRLALIQVVLLRSFRHLLQVLQYRQLQPLLLNCELFGQIQVGSGLLAEGLCE